MRVLLNGAFFTEWKSSLEDLAEFAELPVEHLSFDPEELKQKTMGDLGKVVQTLLDTTALQKGYDSIISMCSYVTSTVPRYKAEAEEAVAWRDSCWSFCEQKVAEVIAGQAPVPSKEELLQMLPQPQWPVT